MSIDPTGSTPLYQQIADDLRHQIQAGGLPAGTRLPPFKRLAQTYAVSIMTINKALAALVSEGLIHSHVGRGSFVAGSPDAAARRLLGFVLRDLNSPYFSLIARGAQERADREGYAILFSSSSDRLDKEDEQIRRFRTLGVDGLIIASMNRTYRPTDAIRGLHTERFPYVMVSYTEGETVPFFGTDLEEVGLLATRHLLEQGRERIGYVCERRGSSSSERRKEGYLRALREAGKAGDPAFQWEYPFQGEWNDYRSGYAIGLVVAGLVERPDALFVYNDLGAIGVMDALLERGVRVPEDVALVGVDDIEQSARARVPLTTVRQPTLEVGAQAVAELIRGINGEREVLRQRHLLEPELVVRRSTVGAPAREVEPRHPPRLSVASVPSHFSHPP